MVGFLSVNVSEVGVSLMESTWLVLESSTSGDAFASVDADGLFSGLSSGAVLEGAEAAEEESCADRYGADWQS